MRCQFFRALPPYFCPALSRGLFLGVFMYDKFLKLKKDKPFLFWVLILPFLIVFILEFYNKYLVSSGKQVVKDAEKQNDNLKKGQQKAQTKAEVYKEEADNIEEKINDINKTIDKDWHLK